MRFVLSTLLIPLCLVSCVLDGDDPSEQNTDSTAIHNTTNVIENSEFPYNQNSIWVYDYMNDTIVQVHQVKNDTLTPASLLSLLNKDYEEKVFCEFIEIRNDTAYVRIPDSEFLTQRMGSTGSYEYLIATTFTITELEGIKYVNFDFTAGDHAIPGTYSRQYFIDEIRLNKSPH